MNDPHPQLVGTSEELEQALTALAWNDATATSNPKTALASLGVDVPDGLRLDVRVQRARHAVLRHSACRHGRRRHRPRPEPDRPLGSGDQFVWVLPHDENVALLNMREHYRRTVSERGR